MEITDSKGNILKVGDRVVWEDPEEQYQDSSRIWTITKLSEEIILISDKYSEAEVFPCELIKLNK